MMDRFFQYFLYRIREVPVGISAGLLAAFVLGAGLFLMGMGFRKGMRWLSGLLLSEYLFLILYWAVFVRDSSVNGGLLLTPFWSYRYIHSGSMETLVVVIANVIVFIPIGFLLGCAFGRIKWWKVLLAGGSFSVLIEVLQFLLKRGFTEFDDIWHNVAGCVVGYGLYAAVAYLVRRRRPERTGLPPGRPADPGVERQE